MPDVPPGCICQEMAGNPAMMDCPFYIVFVLDGFAGSPDAAMHLIINDLDKLNTATDWETATDMLDFIESLRWICLLRFLLLGIAIFGIVLAVKKRKMMLKGDYRSSAVHAVYGGAPPVVVGAPVAVPAVVQATVVEASNEPNQRV
ncbi:KCND3 [Symbiodinium sp. CCMP2592]|nr:KCND3 [Symbiodinium sp. CCMP2592]